MSDYYEEVVGPWHPRDDRDIDADQAEADRADAKHEAMLDRRDRDLPMAGTGLCPACRSGNAAVPGGTLCADCLAEVVAA